jgi:hypothetical protein
MTTTTENFGKKIVKAVTKGCKPSHEAQRTAIGGGYLVCPICEVEIPNEL